MRVRIAHVLVVGGAVLALSVPAVAQGVPAKTKASAAQPTCPSFSAGNFPKLPKVTNPYFPLNPGDLYTYKGNLKKQPVVDTVYVTRNTKTIDGVTTIEVRDRVYESGTLTEDTLDWYAQDSRGNVWYFGELATQLPDGTTTGSWTA